MSVKCLDTNLPGTLEFFFQNPVLLSLDDPELRDAIRFWEASRKAPGLSYLGSKVMAFSCEKKFMQQGHSQKSGHYFVDNMAG